jgi:mycothiol synthase
MNYLSHSYRSVDDLYAVGELIRSSYARQPNLNAWSFCRFDIWARRRIADADSFRDTGWQPHVRLWRVENGLLAGAAFASESHHWRKNPDPHAVILDPDHLDLVETMLDWMESCSRPDVEVLDSHTFLSNLVRSRGYTCSDDCMIVREKRLADTSLEPVDLPPGYRIKVLKPKHWIPYFVAVNSVFNMMDTVDAFRSVQQAPSNIPDLHLNAVNEQGEIAAFCSVWWDRRNNLAEFEPVGTVPRFQKLGLASALMAQACNRLREASCQWVKVESWSESLAANRLYERCGFVEKDRLYGWKK